jgi:hypothetical protein
MQGPERRKGNQLLGRNQQCTVERIDNPYHEGAAVLAGKFAAYEAATVESRFS